MTFGENHHNFCCCSCLLVVLSATSISGRLALFGAGQDITSAITSKLERRRESGWKWLCSVSKLFSFADSVVFSGLLRIPRVPGYLSLSPCLKSLATEMFADSISTCVRTESLTRSQQLFLPAVSFFVICKHTALRIISMFSCVVLLGLKLPRISSNGKTCQPPLVPIHPFFV